MKTEKSGLKIGIFPIISTIIASVVLSVSLVNNTKINSKIVPLEIGNYDYLVSTSTNNNVQEIDSLSIVESSVPMYNFSFSKSNKVGNLLFTPKINELDITFFQPKLLTKGEYKSDNFLIDTIFAETHNFKVGDTISVNLNNTILEIPVSGVFHATYLPNSFENGVAIAEWTPTMSNYFSTELTYDLVFVKTSDQNGFKNYLTSNHLSHVSRTGELDDVVSRLQPSKDRISNTLIITAALYLAGNLVAFFLLLETPNEKKKIDTHRKEMNVSFLKNYKTVNFITNLVSGLILVVPAIIVVLLNAGFNSGSLQLIIIPLVCFLLISVISSVYISKITSVKKRNKSN